MHGDVFRKPRPRFYCFKKDVSDVSPMRIGSYAVVDLEKGDETDSSTLDSLHIRLFARHSKLLAVSVGSGVQIICMSAP